MSSLFKELRTGLNATDHNFVRFDQQDSDVRNATSVSLNYRPLRVYREDLSEVDTFMFSNADYDPDPRSKMDGTVRLADRGDANEFDGVGTLSLNGVHLPRGVFRETLATDEDIDFDSSTSGVSVNTATRTITGPSGEKEIIWKCLNYNTRRPVSRVWAYHKDFEIPADTKLFVGFAPNMDGTDVVWTEVDSYFDFVSPVQGSVSTVTTTLSGPWVNPEALSDGSLQTFAEFVTPGLEDTNEYTVEYLVSPAPNAVAIRDQRIIDDGVDTLIVQPSGDMVVGGDFRVRFYAIDYGPDVVGGQDETETENWIWEYWDGADWQLLYPEASSTNQFTGGFLKRVHGLTTFTESFAGVYFKVVTETDLDLRNTGRNGYFVLALEYE